MRRNLLLLLVSLCATYACPQQRIDLSGTWRFATDRESVGAAEHWFATQLPETVTLPGSMMTNDKGDEVNITTPWIGQKVDVSFFRDDRYAPYRKADNFKVPFWLQPNKYYAGTAWYQRDIDIPQDWIGKDIRLVFERCHWESRVWIDDIEIGRQNALSAPHVFCLPMHLSPGRHVLTVSVNNEVYEIDPGQNSHSMSDHTMGNWNGIIGKMYMEAFPEVFFKSVDVYPSLSERKLGLIINVRNTSANDVNASLRFNLEGKEISSQKQIVHPGDNNLSAEMTLPEYVDAWDEFNPNLYTLDCNLIIQGKQAATKKIRFGCRELSVIDGVLHVNSKPAFMRGTLHCASFPISGYPSTDKDEWIRELKACQAHGLNHIRFHSWCPPEAAFDAADELGMYLHVECSSWANQSTTLGDGKPIDEFIYQEAERIVKAYGNHPSFCFMAYGNEPGGSNHSAYLTDFVTYWKNKDNRRLYTSAAGWPNLPVNDFLSDPNPRIQQWGQGLGSIINAEEPSTTYDWSNYTSKLSQPVISHEIGQWCVYPNFNEMKKYTGVYKPRNFEIFKETLADNGMSALADSFLLASGKLQTLCYKADIEAALRTKNFGGFQLLGLNDFTGQGTALVGTLDAFWEEKGYVTPDEYTRFCNCIVPLARMPKLVLDNDETFVAHLEVANYKKELTKPEIVWVVKDSDGNMFKNGRLNVPDIPIGNCIKLGDIQFSLSEISSAKQFNLEVKINDEYANDWNFWVYPALLSEVGNVLLTDTLDTDALGFLDKGGNVLLSIKQGSLPDELGGDIAVGFSSIFWNTSWTNGQPPHTLGILCDPNHPALANFPTEFYSDYQWHDALCHSSAIRLDRIDNNVSTIVRVIDDWFTNRPLALLFELKVGTGKLLVSGIDFHQDINNRPAARQLLYSLLNYLKSD